MALGCLQSLIDSFTQGFAWLEVQHAFFRYFDRIAIARIAPNTRCTSVDRETAETTDLNPVALL